MQLQSLLTNRVITPVRWMLYRDTFFSNSWQRHSQGSFNNDISVIDDFLFREASHRHNYCEVMIDVMKEGLL